MACRSRRADDRRPVLLAYRDVSPSVRAGQTDVPGRRSHCAYLDELGVSHLYASPCLKARAGSDNGYAIVDYAQLNPELGSAAD